MNKTIALVTFSVLFLASMGSHNVFAGSPPAFNCGIPNPSQVMISLDPSESSTPIHKSFVCNNEISNVLIDASDCTSQGIGVTFANDMIVNLNEYEIDETITNTDGTPGDTHCFVLFDFISNPIADSWVSSQDIWVTTSQQVIGGTIIPIDKVSLILANTQSFSWMIPVILSGIGIGLFVISRKSE